MTSTEPQPQLHPAADILREHLLLDVEKENEGMRDDIGRLQLARDFLGSIEIRLSSGDVVTMTIDDSAVVAGHPESIGKSILVTPIDCGPVPLLAFDGAKVVVSGQVIGSFGNPRFARKEEGSPTHKFLVSKHVLVHGYIRGLDSGDLGRFRNASTTEGPDSNDRNDLIDSATFTMKAIQFIITDELQEKMSILGALPMFEGGELLPSKQSATIQCPPLSEGDASRLEMIRALGCSDSQLKLLGEHKSLTGELFCLGKAKELLGTVGICHAKGRIRLSLSDGVLVEGEQGSYWFIETEETDDHVPVALNDLGTIECFIAGERLEKETVGFDGNRTFVNTYLNGTYMFGLFEEETIQDMGTEELVDTMRRVMSGESLFPSTSKLNSPCVVIPFESVKKALDVLGVDDSEVLLTGDMPTLLG